MAGPPSCESRWSIPLSQPHSIKLLWFLITYHSYWRCSPLLPGFVHSTYTGVSYISVESWRRNLTTVLDLWRGDALRIFGSTFFFGSLDGFLVSDGAQIHIYIQGSEMCFCSALRLTLNVGNADWIIFRGFACLVDHLQIRAPWRSPCRIHLSLLSVGHQTIIEVICLARGFLCSCWTSILVILSWGRRGIMERRRKIYGYNWLTISMAHLTC